MSQEINANSTITLQAATLLNKPIQLNPAAKAFEPTADFAPILINFPLVLLEGDGVLAPIRPKTKSGRNKKKKDPKKEQEIQAKDAEIKDLQNLKPAEIDISQSKLNINAKVFKPSPELMATLATLKDETVKILKTRRRRSKKSKAKGDGVDLQESRDEQPAEEEEKNSTSAIQ